MKQETGEMFDVEMPFIYQYTRAQAIADGLLIDLSDNPIIKSVFKVPVAMSHALFSDTIMGEDDDEKDISLPLTFLVQAVEDALRKPGALNKSMVPIQLPLLESEGYAKDAVINIGPGDEEEPVVTICYLKDL